MGIHHTTSDISRRAKLLEPGVELMSEPYVSKRPYPFCFLVF